MLPVFANTLTMLFKRFGEPTSYLFNHCPHFNHFTFFLMHVTDSMPISSIGGIWSADLWNPKYVLHVYKVTVAVDMLGNRAPGTSADVLIWDGFGPSRTRGDFLDFEVRGHDGAYKGRIHVILPFIARNGTLPSRQQSYNDVHGWYRARIEQLFAHLWHWGLFRNIRRGGPNKLHQVNHASRRKTFFQIATAPQTWPTIRGGRGPTEQITL